MLFEKPDSGLYSVFDRTGEEFSPVFEAQNDGVAIRMFRYSQRDQPAILTADFRLYHVGLFNRSNGKVTCFDQPHEVFLENQQEE